jgi:acyl carrier protein
LVTGEFSPRDSALQAAASGTAARFGHIYGIKEAPIYATGNWPDFRKDSECLPMGRPVNNIKIYIVDKALNLQPVGVTGRLFLGKNGLTYGYLNNPGLTAEKFISPSPITHHPSPLYKTGDLARWLADGSIEFLGKEDRQVKIRGTRLQLEKIEIQLLKYKNIKEALLTSYEDELGRNHLCAYITGTGALEELPGKAELRDYLSTLLPLYMIPSYYMYIETIPLTPGGQIDTSALPAPDIQTEMEYTAPRDELERKLVGIWAEILRIDPCTIGIDSNYFQLGGHSFNATIVISRVQKEMNAALSLVELFKSPSIRGISQYIRRRETYRYPAILPAEEKEYYRLSSAQERLYVVDQVVNDIHTTYNIPYALSVEGELDRQRFESAFAALIQGHESLRTSFHMIDGDPGQIIHDEVEFQIQYDEAHPTHTLQEMINHFIRPFDLSRPPLLRVDLIKLEKGKSLLVFDMHHIVTDGVSMRMIIQDFVQVYKGEEPPRLSIQYKDFARWQFQFLETERMNQQQDYWLRQFQGQLPVLSLPTDYTRSAVQSFKGDQVFFSINMELTAKLRDILVETNTTLYIMLLALYNILLSRISGQEDIVVGIASSGRTHPDIDNVVGVFINTLAIRNQPKGDKTSRAFLQEVKENAVNAYENQDYPFEKLVDKLTIPRDFSRNPLVDVLFVSENVDAPELRVEGVTFSPYEFVNPVSHVDMILLIIEEREEIRMMLDYSTALFKRSTAENFIRCYLEVLRQTVENLDLPVGMYDIPFNMEGKIGDKSGLPEPQLKKAAEYVAPQSEIEITIASVWKEILNRDKVGINDIFFEVGGNSLGLLKMKNRLKEILGKEIPDIKFLEYPTIGSFSDYLQREIVNMDSDAKGENRVPEEEDLVMEEEDLERSKLKLKRRILEEEDSFA